MADIVFILGAGASHEAGAPLMDKFLDTARQLHNKPSTQPFRADFDLVFQAISKLQAVYAKTELKLDNLEEVFGAFEMARTIRKFPDSSIDLDRLVPSFKRVIAHTLEESVEFPAPSGQVRPPMPIRPIRGTRQEARYRAQPEGCGPNLQL